MFRSHQVPIRLARAAAVLALVAATLGPSAAPARALSPCAPTVSCAQFTITLGGTGSGFAESSDIATGVPDGHIDCHLTNGQQTGTCSYLYEWPLGQATYNIHLDAAPSMGNVVCFTNGSCLAEGYSTPLPIQLQNGKPSTYEIDFKKAKRTLTVEAVFEAGPAQGHVVKATNIESIDCPTTCSWDFDYGDVVDLVALPPSGYVFVGGFDACAGLSQDCVVTMTDNISAGFTFIPFTLASSGPKSTPTLKKSPGASTGPGSSAQGSPTLESLAPSAAPASGAETPAATAADAATATAAPSPTAATGGDPLVIGLLGVIAALLLVLAIGILVVARRRPA